MTDLFNALQKSTFRQLPFKVYEGEVKKTQLLAGNKAPVNELVVLAFAFNMALENYASIRKVRDAEPVKDKKTDAELSVLLKRYFSAKFIQKADFFDSGSEEGHEYRTLREFGEIEPRIYNVLQRFRNYFSHILHEPGVISLTDYFNGNTAITSDDFAAFRTWLEARFTEAHRHMVASLENARTKNSELPDRLAEINRALAYFGRLKFNAAQATLSYETMLFFACMFLTRKQAKMILEKWPEFKVVNGYENTIKTFFSYYCLRQNYAVGDGLPELMRFRAIMGMLTAIPLDPNPQMVPVYEKLREMNLLHFGKLDELEAQVKERRGCIKEKQASIRQKKGKKGKTNDQEIKKMQDQIEVLYTEIKALQVRAQQTVVPLKRRYLFTPALVHFIRDNGLLKSGAICWKVAVVKQMPEKLAYYELHADDLQKEKNLVFLKNQIKGETDSARKRKLNIHLKELKRSFTFKPIKTLNAEDKILINRKNAMFQISREGFEPLTVILPPDLLKKWVFLFLVDPKRATRGQQILETYLSDYWNKLQRNHQISSNQLISGFGKKFPWVRSALNPQGVRAFPRSVYRAAGIHTLTSDAVVTRILHKIKLKKQEIERLRQQNALQPKPWRFAAKQKIDVILDYLHFCLLEETYSATHIKCPEAHIRHTAFSIDDYDIAREYLRFFGRYKNRTLVEGTGAYSYPTVSHFIQQYAVYFAPIEKEIKYSQSLEDLYTRVSEKWLSRLVELQDRVGRNVGIAALALTFKTQDGETVQETEQRLRERGLKNICVPDEIFQLKELLPEQWASLPAGRKLSEFALIRKVLAERNPFNTNADYIYKCVLPHCGFNKLPRTINQKLLSMKNDELVMLEMARFYWKKASGADLDIAYSPADGKSDDYFTFTPYNKIYKTLVRHQIHLDLAKTVTGERIEKYAFLKSDSKRESAFRQNNLFVDIPAGRMDDQFLSAESKLMADYIAWYEHEQVSKNKTVFDYDEIHDKIIRELGKNIKLVQLVLQAERVIVGKNGGTFKSELYNKYGKSQIIKDFYIEFKNKHIYDELKKAILGDAVKFARDKIKNSQMDDEGLKNILGDYLLLFRNFALHYKIQDPTLADSLKCGLQNFLKAHKKQKRSKVK